MHRQYSCRESLLAQIFPIAAAYSPSVFIEDQISQQWHVTFQVPFGGSSFSKQQLKVTILQHRSFISFILGTVHKGSFQVCSTSQVDLIDPAVRGTLNVLRSFAKVSSIRRVVVTSSMAAGAFIGKTLTPDVVVDETWFSDPAVCEKLKTLAEEAAWKFAKENKLDLVAINPGLVIGPLLQPALNTSVEPVLKLINGNVQQIVHKHFPVQLIDGLMLEMLPMHISKRLRFLQLMEDIVWFPELHIVREDFT
ncbi:hypothetical protein AAG906_004778 [Vitis piasezkii]